MSKIAGCDYYKIAIIGRDLVLMYSLIFDCKQGVHSRTLNYTSEKNNCFKVLSTINFPKFKDAFQN